ncbi:GAF domain-containing protein [Actinokineospora inagensis]|uniref:GAF domain-containing protein n=1 Tax=Actinokineospora inagensis TaxID=103730 RepID=UPI0012FCEB83|nr:GAF domain-containing protein [Actinokineospora inagensis]
MSEPTRHHRVVDEAPPIAYAADDLVELRAGHPLAGVLPVLRATLVDIADEAEHVMVVADAAATVLWREGRSDVRNRADGIGLTEGARWSEQTAGTNAIGTALAADAPVAVHGVEHQASAAHPWTCAAAPIHDPDTGAVLGVVDVTGPAHTRHPTTLALVTAAARLAEAGLRELMTTRDERMRQQYRLQDGVALLSSTGRVIAAEGCGLLPARIDLTAPTGALEPIAGGYLFHAHARQRHLRLDFLGADSPVAVLDGVLTPLSMRHAEILALLAIHRDGLTADRLALALYGESGNPVTVRAEVHRLRAATGIVLTRPYRLSAEVTADFLELPHLIRSGKLREAAARGPLLPRSDAPEIRALRTELVTAVHRAVIDTGDHEDLWTLVQGPTGSSDLEVVQTLLDVLPRTDSRLPIIHARLTRLLADSA